jgi:hypothetical protein
MATLQLNVTIADADMPRVLAACKDTFNNPNMVEAEVSEVLRQHGIGLIQGMIHNYERKVAIAEAEALDPQITVT